MNAIFSAYKFNNAEFLRNLWIEFSWIKVAVIPLLMLLVAFIIAGADLFQKPESFCTVMYFITLLCAIMSHLVMANLSAAAAIRVETTDNTWDFQRMSSLTSGELSMGKLYGATSFYNYCTLLAIIINVICIQFMPIPSKELWYYMTLVGPISLLLCGFLGQSISFWLSINPSASTSKRKGGSSGAALLGIIASGNLFYHFTQIGLMNIGHNYLGGAEVSSSVVWHGFHIETIHFMILSLAFFLLCTHMGIYRLMRIEMQYKNMPFVWIAFVFAMLVYLTGVPDVLETASSVIAFEHSPIAYKLLLASFLILPVAYMGGYTWAGNTVGYTRFFTSIRNKDTQSILTSIPPWFINTAITGLLIVITMIATPQQTDKLAINGTVLIFGVFWMMIRDIIIFHTILMPGATKHPGFIIILYVVCMYLLGPEVYETQDFALFMPITKGSYFAQTPLIIEIILAAGLLYLSYKKANKIANSEPSPGTATP